MYDEHAVTHIASLISEDNEAVVNAINTQGYTLELDRKYSVTIIR